MQQLPLGVRLPDRAVFASFLPAGNTEALAYLEGVAARTQRAAGWLWGPAGSGKSHLLQAVCVAASDAGRAGYLPLAELAPLGPEALEGWPELDCVALDDLDAVAGQLPWERAIFNLYRELEERGARFIGAASSPPGALPWSLPDLKSRLAAGALFRLQPLDDTQRRQALQLRARLRGVELPEETVRWLERRYPRDMRSLYSVLDTLDEAALREQRRLTVPFIRRVLEDARPL